MSLIKILEDDIKRLRGEISREPEAVSKAALKEGVEKCKRCGRPVNRGRSCQEPIHNNEWYDTPAQAAYREPKERVLKNLRHLLRSLDPDNPVI